MRQFSSGALEVHAILFLALLTSCSPDAAKVEGEVFVVTEGRENIELGLVNVDAFRAETLEEHFQERHQTSRDSTLAKISTCATLLDTLARLGGKRNQLKAELDSQREKLLQGREQGGFPSLEEYLSRNRTTASQLSPGERVVIAVNGADFSRERGVERTYRALSAGEEVTVVDKKGGQIKVETGEKEGWVYHRNLSKMNNYRKYRQVGRLQNDISALSSEMDSIEQNVTRIIGQISRLRTQGFYLSSLPTPAESDKTGSDGQFEMSLPSGTPHFLVAEASRSLNASKEVYRWTVPITPGDTQEIILSNDNLGQLSKRDYILSESGLNNFSSVTRSAISKARKGESAPWEKVLASATLLNAASSDARALLTDGD